MWFVGLGVVLVLMNLLGFGPPGDWNWNILGDLWKFVLPFILAAFWWAWADASGYNKRREQERMDKKKLDRRNQNLAALGLDHRARRKPKQ
jgi:small Trp-rich protein